MPRFRWKAAALVLGVLAGLPAAPAARAQTAALKIRSLEALLSDFHYLAALAGAQSQAAQVDALIKKSTAGKGLVGVDLKRPLGLYFNWPNGWVKNNFQNFPVVAFVPVTGEKEFLELLRLLQCKVQKAAGGIYPLEVPGGMKVFLRFARRYAYAALDRGLLRGKLPDPRQMLPAAGKHTLLAASLYGDRIPRREKKALIDRFIHPIFQGLRDLDALDIDPNTLNQLERNKDAMLATVNGGREIRLLLDVDQTRHHLALDLSLHAKPKSKLAAGIRWLGSGRSMFANLTGGAQAGFSFYLPSGQGPRKRSSTYLESLENVVQPRRRPLMRRLAKALSDYNSLDVFDGFLAFHLREGGPTLTAGLRVKNGLKLENLLRDLLKDLTAADRKLYRLRWNYARHAGQRIHTGRLEVQLATAAHPADLYATFRKDAILASLAFPLGRGSRDPKGDPPGLAALKEALDRLDKPAAAGAPLLRADVNPVWVAVAAALFEGAEKDRARAASWYERIASGKVDAAAVRKLRGTGPGDILAPFDPKELDRIKVRVVLRGGRALRLRVALHTYALKLVPVFTKTSK
jgi:hypothetical protein